MDIERKTQFRAPTAWRLHDGGTSVNGDDGHLVASCGFLPYRNKFEAKENAQFIALAPDVFKALKSVVSRWDGSTEDRTPREVKDARIVIEKVNAIGSMF